MVATSAKTICLTRARRFGSTDWGLALGGIYLTGGSDLSRWSGFDRGHRDRCFWHGVGRRLRGLVVGDLVDHAASHAVEADAVGVFHGDVEGLEHEVGTAEVDGVAGDGVDDFHERGLDGLLVFDESDGVEAGVRWHLDAAHHALVEVAELLSAESGGAAADSGDLDVSANLDAWMNRHIDTSKNLIPFS